MARRLREHAQQLTRQVPRPVPRAVVGPPRGTPVPDFSVTTISGAVISAADLRGERSLIGFFLPGCAPCHDQIPAFTAFARSLPGGPGHALAVVADGTRSAAGTHRPDADRLAEELAATGVAQVVRGSSAAAAETVLAVSGHRTPRASTPGQVT